MKQRRKRDIRARRPESRPERAERKGASANPLRNDLARQAEDFFENDQVWSWRGSDEAEDRPRAAAY